MESQRCRPLGGETRSGLLSRVHGGALALFVQGSVFSAAALLSRSMEEPGAGCRRIRLRVAPGRKPYYSISADKRLETAINSFETGKIIIRVLTSYLSQAVVWKAFQHPHMNNCKPRLG